MSPWKRLREAGRGTSVADDDLQHNRTFRMSKRMRNQDADGAGLHRAPCWSHGARHSGSLIKNGNNSFCPVLLDLLETSDQVRHQNGLIHLDDLTGTCEVSPLLRRTPHQAHHFPSKALATTSVLPLHY
ncbi:unnamed protein product [Arctogadus glacialis]